MRDIRGIAARYIKANSSKKGSRPLFPASSSISIPGDPIAEGLSHTEESAGKAGAGTLGTIEAPHA